MTARVLRPAGRPEAVHSVGTVGRAGGVGRAGRVGALVVSAAAVLSGCSAYDLPLPGGAGTGPDSYTVTVEFADVLDLVPQSSVKVNQVTVGSVEAIDVAGWKAVVTLRLPGTLQLPDNAVAELRQTSLLGEKFVSLAAPAGEAPIGRLSDGDRIPLERSGRHPEVEEVLGAMSLLLNGGGVAQLKTIEVELDNAMRGRSDQFRSVIDGLGTFIGGLDEQKADIVRAIDSLDRLSGTWAHNQDTIAATLDELPKGLKVLADQRQQLTAMLTALADLGEVGTRVIEGSREDLEANLRALAPILTELNRAGDNLPKSYQLLLTYPFPSAAGPALKGDFTNLWVTLDADLGGIAHNMHVARMPESSVPSAPAAPSRPGAAAPVPAPGSVPSLPLPTPSVTLPGLPSGSAGQASGASDSPAAQGTSWTSLFETGASR